MILARTLMQEKKFSDAKRLLTPSQLMRTIQAGFAAFIRNIRIRGERLRGKEYRARAIRVLETQKTIQESEIFM